MLKQIDHSVSKPVGVAEVKCQSIDVKCRTRETVLKLYLTLKRIDYIYNLSLYETENIHLLIDWVPISIPNETIKNYIQTNHKKVIAITKKWHKDGLILGIKIVTMIKYELEPSYIAIYQYRAI